MRLSKIAKLVEARVVSGEIDNVEIERGFSSDLMSDVLTLDTNNMLLITGMTNLQAIRTADMADVNCILFVRNKRATPEMIELANELGIIMLESPLSMFRISGMLYCDGLNPVY